LRVFVSACLALALTLTPLTPEALAAPMGLGVEAAQVLDLHADLGNDVAAKTLTNALRQRVLESKEFTLNSESSSLFSAAREAKCPLKHWARPVVLANERAFDEKCLRRIGEQFRTRQFFWGFVYIEGPRAFVRLHVWQEGKGDRAATLPYDAAQPDRLADRLYKKLVTPTAVGDLVLAGAVAGEIFVDGKPTGPYADGVELTLETGLHEVEVRDGQHVVARARVRVEPGGRSEAKLTRLAEPPQAPTWPASPSGRPFAEPPAVVVRPRASAWPWVLGGATGAGLAGAGAFWALRSGVRSDLERGCFGNDCPEYRRDDVQRGDLYATLAGVSLGVGLAAGAGLAAYLLTPRRARPVSGVVVVPAPGGAVAGFSGAF
jgi:hypothetical protein